MINTTATYHNDILTDVGFRATLPIGYSAESTATLYFILGVLGCQMWSSLIG